MQRFRDRPFPYIVSVMRDEYIMRGQTFNPQFPITVLKHAVLEVERGLLEMPHKSIFFWADETIDFCLKYIEISGMVKHRKARSRLLREQSRREANHVRIQNREGAVEIYNC